MKRKIKSFNFILNSVGQADGILIPKLRKRSRKAKAINWNKVLNITFFHHLHIKILLSFDFVGFVILGSVISFCKLVSGQSEVYLN